MNAAVLADNPSSFPAQAASFMLTGPVGRLESLSDVAEVCHARAGTAVICHPHPVQGGSMHNKVVTILERSLRELGFDTLRFNFRGTGKSDGCYDEGRGESEDLVAVVSWLCRVRPQDALWLAGFSFGSYITIANAGKLQASCLISVAPPIGLWEVNSKTLPRCPWLVVMGEEDTVVQPQLVFDWIASMEHPPALVRMSEAGHFFHRRLMDLRGAVKHAVRDWLPPPRDD